LIPKVPSGGGGVSAAPAAGGGAPAAAAETKEEEKKEEKVRTHIHPLVLSDLTFIHCLCRKSQMRIWASVCSIRIKLYRCNATIFLA
jgi:hypothetical protein